MKDDDLTGRGASTDDEVKIPFNPEGTSLLPREVLSTRDETIFVQRMRIWLYESIKGSAASEMQPQWKYVDRKLRRNLTRV